MESRGTIINRCLHNSVSCMGRLSLRDCKASFLRAMPSALVPWDFLRLSWKPGTPGDDSWPWGLLVGSKDMGESGKSNSGPFWQASALLFSSRLPSSFGTSLRLTLVAGKERFTELCCKPLRVSLLPHPHTAPKLLSLDKNTGIAKTVSGKHSVIRGHSSNLRNEIPSICLNTVPSNRISNAIIKYLQNFTQILLDFKALRTNTHNTICHSTLQSHCNHTQALQALHGDSAVGHSPGQGDREHPPPSSSRGSATASQFQRLAYNFHTIKSTIAILMWIKAINPAIRRQFKDHFGTNSVSSPFPSWYFFNASPILCRFVFLTRFYFAPSGVTSI